MSSKKILNILAIKKNCKQNGRNNKHYSNIRIIIKTNYAFQRENINLHKIVDI